MVGLGVLSNYHRPVMVGQCKPHRYKCYYHWIDVTIDKHVYLIHGVPQCARVVYYVFFFFDLRNALWLYSFVIRCPRRFYRNPVLLERCTLPPTCSCVAQCAMLVRNSPPREGTLMYTI